MKSLLLLLPLLLAAPISAQVDPAVHKLCVDAKDYSGCVQTQLSLSKKAKLESKPVATSKPTELTPWQNHLNENPSLKAWVEANPSLAKKKREEWVKNNDLDIQSCSTKHSGEKQKACWKKRAAWLKSPESKNFKPLIDSDSELKKSIKEESAKQRSPLNSNNSQCPPGTQMYKTKGLLFGLGSRELGCMTANEANEYNLRAAELRIMQKMFKPNYPSNCTTTVYGNTASTNCY